MPIDPAEPAASIGTLYQLDLERGLAATLQEVRDAAKVLVDADGAGLMLADTDGRLRWASASDQLAQTAEEQQERTPRVPCLAAFVQRTPMSVADARQGPDSYGMRCLRLRPLPALLTSCPQDRVRTADQRWDALRRTVASALLR